MKTEITAEDDEQFNNQHIHDVKNISTEPMIALNGAINVLNVIVLKGDGLSIN